MIKKFILGACAVTMLGGTGAAYVASTQGWGLSTGVDEPVNLRQENSEWRRGRRGGMGFFYFGSRRRHYGGGYSGGK